LPQVQTQVQAGNAPNLAGQSYNQAPANSYNEGAVIDRYKQKLAVQNSYVGGAVATGKDVSGDAGVAFRGGTQHFRTESKGAVGLAAPGAFAADMDIARRSDQSLAAAALNTDTLTIQSGRMLGFGAVAQPPAAKPTGLASLDVQIPVRGQTFYFTAPHGDVQMHAWSVSQSATGRGARSLFGLLGLSLLVGLLRFTRKRIAA
jgi:hypothetical protein